MPDKRFCDFMRRLYVSYFNMQKCRPERDMPDSLVRQLFHCKSDDARRLILGISHKMEAEGCKLLNVIDAWDRGI